VSLEQHSGCVGLRNSYSAVIHLSTQAPRAWGRGSRVYLPKGPEQVVDQALGAVQRAWADGIRRQSLELLLPLIGATDLDDW